VSAISESEAPGTRAARRFADAFHEQFAVVVADSDPLREAGFALRHEVYCRELGFERVRVDGLERDAYDDRSLHYLLAHVPSGAWAGCVRIVLDDGAGLGLPFERARLPLLEAVPRGSIGEISRLTVAPAFRQGGAAELGGLQPNAVLGTALTALAATAEAGLTSAVCMMKPRFERQLLTYGIRFTQRSPVVDYVGLRALFHLSPRTTCLGIDPELQGVLEAMRAQIAQG
jgi:N-acyl amino acid synthase of PEP-CTERM/exosortase system